MACGRDGSGKLKTTLGTEGYMAPELLNKNSTYNGVPNDIFGAGVILFIFMTGLPPFKMASPRDPHFGQFCINRHYKFWEAHKHRLKMNFSEDFMTLINAMLSYDPTHRTSIPEIYAHPWLKDGKIATREEVVAEFTQRKKYVDKAIAKQKKDEEAMKAAQKNQKVPNMAFGPITAHRGNTPNETVNDTTWTDIASRFAEEKMDEFRFSEVDPENVRPGALSSSDLKTTDFVQAIYWIAEQAGAHVT
jgi:serine/threonine protein kinase